LNCFVGTHLLQESTKYFKHLTLKKRGKTTTANSQNLKEYNI